ncbi:Hypothetical protein PHPALM_13044 [Phytophthora palmivora]|uniref:PDZ domain-containing protein n=1 Tax=Phytophthora palmivora TaxID=4796 RepID=A0A2P4XY74_9STRA|nr:Hypothetical protein PHPALM_13044 [Phytophthora palmivora]
MATGSQGREIHVLLKLHDGERSFGMSLAQRSPTLGPKYTVVSSVFANSPADRAGVRKGYVVRCINDKPMAGLTVAQVANHFRNVGQAKITLEIVESAVSPRSTAFTAAVTFGGVATLPNRPTTQTAGANGAQRPTTPVTGFSAVSSGRAIAAPGSALAVPTVAAPKQPVLRLGAKPAAKALGLRPESGPGSSVSAGMVTFADASMPSADAKTADDAKHTGLKSKAVAPILRLGLKSKPAQPEIAAEKVAATTTSVASKSIPTNPSSRIPQSPVQTIEAPRRTTSAQVSQGSLIIAFVVCDRTKVEPNLPLVFLRSCPAKSVTCSRCACQRSNPCANTAKISTQGSSSEFNFISFSCSRGIGHSITFSSRGS